MTDKTKKPDKDLPKESPSEAIVKPITPVLTSPAEPEPLESNNIKDVDENNELKARKKEEKKNKSGKKKKNKAKKKSTDKKKKSKKKKKSAKKKK